MHIQLFKRTTASVQNHGDVMHEVHAYVYRLPATSCMSCTKSVQQLKHTNPDLLVHATSWLDADITLHCSCRAVHVAFSSHHACSHHIMLQVHITFRGHGVMWLPQRGSIHESQGGEGDKLYSVHWPQDQDIAGVEEEPLVSRFSSYDAPLGGVAPLPTSENRVLVLHLFFFFKDHTFHRKKAVRVWHVNFASTNGSTFLPACASLFLLVPAYSCLCQLVPACYCLLLLVPACSCLLLLVPACSCLSKSAYVWENLHSTCLWVSACCMDQRVHQLVCCTAVQFYCKQSAGVAPQQQFIAAAVLCSSLCCCLVSCFSLYCCVLLCCASTLSCHAVPCRAVLCCAVLCCAVLCCAVLRCAALRCAALCCAVLCRLSCVFPGWNVFSADLAVLSIRPSHERGVQHAA